MPPPIAVALPDAWAARRKSVTVEWVSFRLPSKLPTRMSMAPPPASAVPEEATAFTRFPARVDSEIRRSANTPVIAPPAVSADVPDALARFPLSVDEVIAEAPDTSLAWMPPPLARADPSFDAMARFPSTCEADMVRADS
jgi:hypothetical protein